MSKVTCFRDLILIYRLKIDATYSVKIFMISIRICVFRFLFIMVFKNIKYTCDGTLHMEHMVQIVISLDAN